LKERSVSKSYYTIFFPGSQALGKRCLFCGDGRGSGSRPGFQDWWGLSLGGVTSFFDMDPLLW